MKQLFVQDNTGEYKTASTNDVFSAARRFAGEKLTPGKVMRSSDDAIAAIFWRLRNKKDKEVFSALFLAANNKVTAYRIIARGTINAATIYPRELIKTALSLNAAAVILAHNHPSGGNTPSKADWVFTRGIWHVCQVMNIKLLDHIIVGDTPLAMSSCPEWQDMISQ